MLSRLAPRLFKIVIGSLNEAVSNWTSGRAGCISKAYAGNPPPFAAADTH